MDIDRLYGIVNLLDQLSDFRKICVGRWLAWPVVKRTVKLLLEEQYYGLPGLHSRTARERKKQKKLSNHGGAVFHAIGQLICTWKWRKVPQQAILTDSDTFRDRLSDGRSIDIFFYHLLRRSKLKIAPFVIEDGLFHEHIYPFAGPRHLYAELLLLGGEALSFTREVKRTVKPALFALLEQLSRVGLNLGKAVLRKSLERRLARFEGTRKIFRMLFKSRNVKALLLIDSNSRFGQIAAAKEMRIPIIELQHGAMGAQNVQYQWHSSLAPWKALMPIPDKILVFGKLWKDMLVEGGFWTDTEIIAAGSARMDWFRASVFKKEASKNNEVLRILYTTQWKLQKQAVKFWGRFLEIAEKELPFEYKLVVKPHQSEHRPESVYQVLLNRFGDRCMISSKSSSTFEEILKADINVSYASSVLLESVGLGIPSVSICEAMVPGGIAQYMGMEWLRETIAHITSPEELVQIVSQNPPGSTSLSQWRQLTEDEGKRVFAEGFFERTEQIIQNTIYGQF
jgi:hypothetical protein